MSDSLHTIDYTVIVLYFAAIVACGSISDDTRNPRQTSSSVANASFGG